MTDRKINAKEAAKIAAKYYNDVVGASGQISIEEIELDSRNEIWNITLGINKNQFGVYMAGEEGKEYKEFAVDASNGDVLKMKIKKP